MQQVQKDTGIFIFSTPLIEGYQIDEYFGLVHGASIQGVHFLKDAMAYLSDKFGGRVHGYESSLEKAMEQAVHDMARKALKMGANAILGVHVNTNEVGNRMLMASCYGTAVRFHRK
ncbi:YbjQ family protein [Comamonas thiooxydans]|uniref:YbjQ family protein n=1 Tax=Comamonas thiooxydans TaxID=363952 RepID=UPI000B422C2A|nr:YbjQ family protein [Comamonas thiooxydans]